MDSFSSFLALVLPHLSLDALVALCMTSKGIQTLVLRSLRDSSCSSSSGGFLFDITSDDCCASGIVSKLLRQSPYKRLVVSPNVTDFGLFHLGVSLALKTFPPFPKTIAEAIELDLSQCSKVTDNGIECLLNAHGSTMAVKPLRVTSLNLSGVWRITEKSIQVIGRLPSLQRLNLSRCYKVCDTETQLGALTALVELDLSGCSNIAMPQTLATVMRNNPDLESLVVDRLATSAMNDAAWALSSLKMNRLRKLSIQGAFGLSDSGLQVIGRIAPNLISLSLCECRNLTSLRSLGDDLLGNLERLEVNGCRNSLLQDGVAGKLKRLKHLEYRHAELDDSLLASLLDSLSSSSSSALRMETIALSGNKKVSEVSSLRSLSNLKEIYLGGCEAVSPSAASELVAFLPNLRAIQLPPSTDDLVLSSIVSTQVVHLDVGKSKTITDQALVSLVSRQTGLESLRLDESAISDLFLSWLSTSSSTSALVKLSGYGCMNTSRQAFARLARSAPFTLKTIMDREGRIVRCTCCGWASNADDEAKWRRSCTSGTSGHRAVVKLRGGSNGHSSREAESSEWYRFASVEAPVIVLSCAVIAADWIMARGMW